MAEASPGVTRRCPAKVEPIGPYVFLWAGVGKGPCVPPLIRADQGLLWASNRMITRHSYGFTDLGGISEEGGGVDADLRIKTSPVNTYGSLQC